MDFDAVEISFDLSAPSAKKPQVIKTWLKEQKGELVRICNEIKELKQAQDTAQTASRTEPSGLKKWFNSQVEEIQRIRREAKAERKAYAEASRKRKEAKTKKRDASKPSQGSSGGNNFSDAVSTFAAGALTAFFSS